MEPKEKTFDFTKDTRNATIGKWIIAVSKIPLMHHNAFTFADVIREISKTYALKTDDANFIRITMQNGFGIRTGYFEDGDVSFDRELECFSLTLYPLEIEEDLRVRFERNNKAYFEIGYSPCAYDTLLKEVGVVDEKCITWQEAYDLLCKIAEYEQKGIPECNVL
jgi:hypothetical protein